MQHLKRFAYECILICGIAVCALMLGCSDSPTAPEQQPIIWWEAEAATTAVRTHQNGSCYTLMWCSHCNGGQGGYIRQKVECPSDMKQPSVHISYPGGN